jgi:Mrp family chromosome partitioning ATPase
VSQNFELLNEIEAEHTTHNGRAAFVPKKIRESEHVLNGLPHEDLLRMAQVVFLSENVATPRVVLICGVDEENGSSQICAELGRTLALSSERNVCLVDGDVRSRRLSKTFDLHRPHTGSTSLQENCVQQAPNLWVTAANTFDPCNGGVLPSTNLLRKAFTDLRKRFDFVLLDAPGVNAHGDASGLAQFADAAILIIEASVTRKQAALKAKAALESVNVRLLGTVLNNRTFPIPAPLYRKL